MAQYPKQDDDVATQRVLNDLARNLLGVKRIDRLAWPVLAWPGQNGTFVLKSTGGFEQVEWSSCTDMQEKLGAKLRYIARPRRR